MFVKPYEVSIYIKLHESDHGVNFGYFLCLPLRQTVCLLQTTIQALLLSLKTPNLTSHATFRLRLPLTGRAAFTLLAFREPPASRLAQHLKHSNHIGLQYLDAAHTISAGTCLTSLSITLLLNWSFPLAHFYINTYF